MEFTNRKKNFGERRFLGQKGELGDILLSSESPFAFEP